jgi:hypothetical protein
MLNEITVTQRAGRVLHAVVVGVSVNGGLSVVIFMKFSL